MAWKDYFTDARLRAVIGLSLENNRDLRVAVAHIAQARARYKVQGADLFPTISAGASGDIAQVPSGLSGLTGGSGGSAGGPANSTRYNLYRGQLGVSAWEIDLFGRVRNLTQAAQEEYFASIDNRAAAQVSLVSEVANAWLQLAADREQLAIARDTHAAFAQTLEITQDRAKMGVASDLDLQQARTSFEQARADIARLTTTVAQDRNALDLLVGTPVGDAMLPEGLDTTEATIGQLPGGLASSVLLKRPDVSSAEHDLRRPMPISARRGRPSSRRSR
jgi:multidrug efflux system outer membrane protein